MQRITDIVKDLVFPPTCSGCGERGVWLCDVCRMSLPAFADIPGRCGRCGLPIVGARCGCHLLHPGISSAASGWPYSDWVAAAIRGVKYDGEADRARFLGSVLSFAIPGSVIQDADYVVPVPMYVSRERERGYNQAYLIAAHACEALGAAPPASLLSQADERPSQVGLSGYQRRRNVRGAFALTEGVRLAYGARIVVVDDVRTTGATLSACVEAMRSQRPKRIDVITVAAELSRDVAEHIGLPR